MYNVERFLFTFNKNTLINITLFTMREHINDSDGFLLSKSEIQSAISRWFF